MPLAAGIRLGAYEIVSPLGTGGMGEVYRARDHHLGREVAIKVLPSELLDTADRAARFEREARVLGSLNHPNIAHVYGFDRADGVRYLVMELVEGVTLEDRLRNGPLTLDEALAAASQIVEALGGAHFAVAEQTGAMVYVPSLLSGIKLSMIWIDRTGAIAAPALPSHEYRQPSLSFDGKRVALEVTGTNRDLWTYDIDRGVMSPLTTTPEEEETPKWSPDGTRVAFASERDGQRGLFLMQSDRSGSEQRLWTTPDHFHVNAWSPNGQSIILNTRALATGQDLSVYSFESRTVTPFVTTPANEFGAAISPDGRWVAYVSDESGREQVYVRPFGRSGGAVQISRDGGSEPAWAHSGREVFFRDVNANQLMTVDVGAGEALQVGPPRLLVKVPFVDADRDSGYVVSQDDKRFLGIRTDPVQEAREIQVTLNWFEELKRLLPP